MNRLAESFWLFRNFIMMEWKSVLLDIFLEVKDFMWSMLGRIDLSKIFLFLFNNL
jgi:hypothetical protein